MSEARDDDALPPRLQALLEAERTRPEPDAQTVDAIRAGAEARIRALSGGGSGGGGGPARPGPVRRGVSGFGHLAAGAFLGVAVSAVVAWAAWPRAPRVVYRERVVERVVVRVVVRDADAGAATSSVAGGPDAGVAVGRAERARDEAVPDREAERRLIDRCTAALARGDAEGALLAAREHARRFRGGALVEEREALTIRALRMLRRTSEADARARSFLARWPSSIHRSTLGGGS
jgi:hypothetical protein